MTDGGDRKELQMIGVPKMLVQQGACGCASRINRGRQLLHCGNLRFIRSGRRKTGSSKVGGLSAGVGWASRLRYKFPWSKLKYTYEIIARAKLPAPDFWESFSARIYWTRIAISQPSLSTYSWDRTHRS